MVPMMWTSDADECSVEELLLPEELIPRRMRPASPERYLAYKVLCTAIEDLAKYRFAKRPSHQRMYFEAWKWVASGDRSWGYSFERLCDALDLDPNRVRDKLLELRQPEKSPAEGNLATNLQAA